jgi:hypothetical protein
MTLVTTKIAEETMNGMPILAGIVVAIIEMTMRILFLVTWDTMAQIVAVKLLLSVASTAVAVSAENMGIVMSDTTDAGEKWVPISINTREILNENGTIGKRENLRLKRPQDR